MRKNRFCSAVDNAAPAETKRIGGLFTFLLAHGVLAAPNWSGALSTPMGEADVDEFLAVLAAGIAAIG